MKISVLMGGSSAERKVSIKTGRAVIRACEELGHQAIPVDFYDDYQSTLATLKGVDLVFNALHGTTGEDGTIQLWLEDNNIPFTGSGSDSSRLCMNKDKSKKTVRDNNFLTPDWFLFDRENDSNQVDFPCIVKPNAQGSTFGLSMIENKEGVKDAITLAFKYDSDVLIEKYIKGREITVGILDGKPLPIVEIIPKHSLYDYECKYSPGMSKYFCPAKLDKDLEHNIKKDSLDIFNILKCRGYGRLDFILDDDGNYYFLEINTLPGMTSTSLLPIAAKEQGLMFEELIDAIIGVSI
tara:strand:- start:233 stop:1117 length:885 start_codon:yes stop_codon:yes gene_type:complete